MLLLYLCTCVLSGEFGECQKENLQKSRNIFSKQPLPNCSFPVLKSWMVLQLRCNEGQLALFSLWLSSSCHQILRLSIVVIQTRVKTFKLLWLCITELDLLLKKPEYNFLLLLLSNYGRSFWSTRLLELWIQLFFY